MYSIGAFNCRIIRLVIITTVVICAKLINVVTALLLFRKNVFSNNNAMVVCAKLGIWAKFIF